MFENLYNSFLEILFLINKLKERILCKKVICVWEMFGYLLFVIR